MGELDSLRAGLGSVVIGRNEGLRLEVCLRSVVPCSARVVYVDSGSTDGSVALARSLGVRVLELNMALPFTAARARNAGVQVLREELPQLRWIQFVDGDCEIVPAWWAPALDFLRTHPDVAVVCGRRRERYPEASVFNRLCDLEWDTPIGPAKACGGDALVRASAFESVAGYRDDLIAGEEPEMCVRLRQAGWVIWRLDQEMTLHDAAIHHVSQWFRRVMRAGHAFAEGAVLHGKPPERHFVGETRRALVWGFLIPLLLLLLGAAGVPGVAWACLIYPVQMLRLWQRGRRQGQAMPGWSAFFWMLGRFPEALGALRFGAKRLAGQRSKLIEYK